MGPMTIKRSINVGNVCGLWHPTIITVCTIHRRCGRGRRLISMRVFSFLCGAFLALVALHHSAEAQDATAHTDALEFFEQRIRPVLVEHCFACHSTNAKQIESGLVLD